jgi:hypothetical protein
MTNQLTERQTDKHIKERRKTADLGPIKENKQKVRHLTNFDRHIIRRDEQAVLKE